MLNSFVCARWQLWISIARHYWQKMAAWEREFECQQSVNGIQRRRLLDAELVTVDCIYINLIRTMHKVKL